ncbi:serine hydrolase domain-containing protein [Aureimonas populi]|uniref:Serine hydrolase domain-containing protein n=1 Tax=Aureimonas populi TaxID=1701758 RepID=A0ABW5CH76_9HYPH|nr:serine hydrolase domain-containing protein [Aureimonas populi]
MASRPHAALIGADGRVIVESSRDFVPWWSFTKTLIATLALKLAGEGRLDLDAPMHDPRYTLRQVLHHTAGLPDYAGLAAYQAAVAAEEAPWSDGELLSRTEARRLRFEPGEGWRYSNIGYLLARRRLEAAGGRSLASLLRETIFLPLSLTEPVLAETASDMAGLALPPPHAYDPGWVFHGTVIGPAGDAARCLHAILEGGLLAPRELGQLLAIRSLGGPLPERPWLATGYGLGVMAGPVPGAEAAGHSAGGPGSVGAVYRFKGAGRTAIAAVFGDYRHEGEAEFEAMRLASR